MRFLFLLALLLLTVHTHARPGLVQTIDGRSLNGDVQFTNGGAYSVTVFNGVGVANSVPVNLIVRSWPSRQHYDFSRTW